MVVVLVAVRAVTAVEGSSSGSSNTISISIAVDSSCTGSHCGGGSGVPAVAVAFSPM